MQIGCYIHNVVQDISIRDVNVNVSVTDLSAC